ncbi:MAG: AAA family ATPase [Myxococcota bacterium]
MAGRREGCLRARGHPHLTPTGLLLLGAAGSGTSTLGRAVSDELGWRHLELDDFLWVATDPPYTTRNPPERRAQLLREAIDGAPAWVLSGSPGSWAEFVVPSLVLVVFLRAPTDVRIARIARREAKRYGAAIEPGGALHDTHAAFLAWAAQYDDGPPEGRSLREHERWLGTLTAPVLPLDTTEPVATLLRAVHDTLGPLGRRPK